MANIMYFVYLLQSEVDNNFYIGYTGDIGKRLTEHNSGQNKSTSSRVPLKLVGYETYDKENEARFREYYLKNHPSEKKRFIKKLIGP